MEISAIKDMDKVPKSNKVSTLLFSQLKNEVFLPYAIETNNIENYVKFL